jgi:aryl-alcohol dehydrogenase-like predicted oxidoreductase
VGLPAAISGKANELTAEALEPIEYSFIPRDAFLQFLRENGEAALRMAEILSDTYEATLHQVRYLGLSASTAERVARFLHVWRVPREVTWAEARLCTVSRETAAADPSLRTLQQSGMPALSFGGEIV